MKKSIVKEKTFEFALGGIQLYKLLIKQKTAQQNIISQTTHNS